MRSQDQVELGSRLDRALESLSVVVERGVYRGGNLQGWERVPGVSIIGKMMALTGWRFREQGAYPDAPIHQYEIRLVK